MMLPSFPLSSNAYHRLASRWRGQLKADKMFFPLHQLNSADILLYSSLQDGIVMVAVFCKICKEQMQWEELSIRQIAITWNL